LRVRYAKSGTLRFTSHRDFARAFERALRRAAVPMAYSAGFSPHPKISYAGAAPTGVASRAEYLEIGLARACHPADIAARLDAALPPGLDIVDVVAASDAKAGLAERLEASLWEVRLPGVEPAAAAAAVDRLLALTSAPVRRATKDGHRQLDARQALIRLTCDDVATRPAADQAVPAECAILTMVVQHTTPAVRPDDVVAALREHAGLSTPAPPQVTRLAQGQLPPQSTAGRSAGSIELTDPLAADFAAARS
jgi:radical SAM-linked protein